MAEQLKVSFIGSGNLAWHLAPALDNVGFSVREIYSPNRKHAEALADRTYQAEVKQSMDFCESSSRIFIIAASDDAINEIAEEIILPEDSFLIHTSGSQPLSVLRSSGSDNIGSFYPLQTFTKNKKADFKTIPIFIEGSNQTTEKTMTLMAKALGCSIKKISSEDRKALHVAAVFASNFTNHMLMLSKEILHQNSLSFDLLKPLITETINKSLTIGPEKTQTGPAFRSDLEILDSHMEFLKDDRKTAEIYQLISQSIIDAYNSD
ncbi:DUF2520 domain-containing protein [soil metagenome]